MERASLSSPDRDCFSSLALAAASEQVFAEAGRIQYQGPGAPKGRPRRADP